MVKGLQRQQIVDRDERRTENKMVEIKKGHELGGENGEGCE